MQLTAGGLEHALSLNVARNRDISTAFLQAQVNPGEMKTRETQTDDMTDEETPCVTSEGDQLEVTYGVEDTPPWALCLLLGFQHYLTAFGSTLSVPLVLADRLCMTYDPVGVSMLIGTVFFVSGIATLMQTTLGIRLPIIQGATFAFLAPTISVLSLPKWECPAFILAPADVENGSTILNNTASAQAVVAGSEEHKEIWQSRVREIQGAVLVASLFQVAVGFSGLMTIMLRFIGPLVVAPTVTLVGLALFDVAAAKSSNQWGVALLTLGLIVVFSQCLHRVAIPMPFGTITKHGCQRGIARVRLFELFPVLLAMTVTWLLCLILTISEALPSDPASRGFWARTDARLSVLKDAHWIRIPYPGQWGLPTVSVGAVLGLLAGVLASIIESIGDYYACARLSNVPPPPAHAINRGIGVEGLACIVAGAFGSANGTTSYSENVAAIGITKVASRRVVQVAGMLLMVMGCFGKAGALFVTIPDPVAGGVFLAMFAMITAVGLSNLQYVEIRLPRNMFVLGLGLFLGMAIPRWIAANSKVIQTGSSAVDQILEVLLSTSMFVGGSVAFVLDNLLPGSTRQRGITRWRQESSVMGAASGYGDVYSHSVLQKLINRKPVLSRLPFCPPVKTRTPASFERVNRSESADSLPQSEETDQNIIQLVAIH